MSGRKRPAGFTLVEVLVGMTILSMLMLALGASLRTFAQTEAKLDARLARVDDRRVVTAFLRAIVGRVSIRKLDPGNGGPPAPLFRGTSVAMEWIGVMPARHGVGGRYFFRLSAESVGSHSALVVRFLPWNMNVQHADWRTATERVLVPRLESFQVAYLMEAKDGSGAAWRPGWAAEETPAGNVPARVMLKIATESGAWPDLVIPLRVLPGRDGNRGGFSLGPE